MTVKIGFHLGPSGGMYDGIGTWMRRINEAGAPFALKSVDHIGHVYEAAMLTRANNQPNFLVLRISGTNWDVPDYSLPPDEAAEEHFGRVYNKLRSAPDFWSYRDLVWVEPVNEIAKQFERPNPATDLDPVLQPLVNKVGSTYVYDNSPWLNEFALSYAILAKQVGMKVLMFGWSAGEPEVEHWENMIPFLSYCADNKDTCGVALHEYSYNQVDLFEHYPYLVGRFQFLMDLCDTHGISRPTTAVTEWGWTLDHVPDPSIGMPQIAQCWNLYSQYENVKGAFLWYLGPGFGDIASKAHRYMDDFEEFILDPPPAPELIPEPTPGPAPIVAPVRLPHAIVTELMPPSFAFDGRAKGVLTLTAGDLRTLTYSADHAAVSALMGREDGSYIRIWNAHEFGGPDESLTESWFADRGYLGITVEFVTYEEMIA